MIILMLGVLLKPHWCSAINPEGSINCAVSLDSKQLSTVVFVCSVLYRTYYSYNIIAALSGYIQLAN